MVADAKRNRADGRVAAGVAGDDRRAVVQEAGAGVVDMTGRRRVLQAVASDICSPVAGVL